MQVRKIFFSQYFLSVFYVVGTISIFWKNDLQSYAADVIFLIKYHADV